MGGGSPRPLGILVSRVSGICYSRCNPSPFAVFPAATSVKVQRTTFVPSFRMSAKYPECGLVIVRGRRSRILHQYLFI